MRGNLALLLISILLLAGSAAAAPAPTNPLTCISSAPAIGGSAISIALVALLVSLNVIAIGYIISKLVPGTKLGDWVRSEFWEVAKSGMLIAGAFAAIVFIGNVSSILAGPGAVSAGTTSSFAASASLVNGACSYLNGEQVFMSDAFNYLLGIAGSLGALAQLQVSAYFPYPPVPVGFLPVDFQFGFQLNPYKNGMLTVVSKTQWKSILGDSIYLIALPVSFIISLQITMLPILYLLGIGMLIPMGIIFRAFPFTRGIGGALFAIGVGVSLIYPALLVLLNAPVTGALQTLSAPEALSGACNFNWLICGLASPLLSMISSFQGIGTAFASFSSIFPALNGILSYAAFMILQFVLFVLDLAITYSLANNIAGVLGGTIRLEIGGKLKLR
ncbi:MAG: hypothetical protein KGI04_00845 [Candidatus Micrarchaeota archaeon]|nr:hypothetical protein [Candidatus Micrarchaeota archaeon]